jgi:hypothetical protein
MIHSSSREKTVFSGAFATKRRSADTPEKYVKIVHTPRNNIPRMQGVITRRALFWPKKGLWSALPHWCYCMTH